MAGPDLRAALAELAGHPYLLVLGRGDSATTPLTGPLPVAEVLDLGFGVADALVEVHSRGLTIDGLQAGSLMRTTTGELRLAIYRVRVGDAADRAADVSALRRVLAGLLPSDDDPTTRATLAVLDDATVPSAAALRDRFAAVRLGHLPARAPMPTADSIRPSGTGAERVGGAVDPAQRLQSRAQRPQSPASPTAAGAGSARRLVLIVLLLVLLGVAVWLMVR